jgi:chemotaxis protein MotB
MRKSYFTICMVAFLLFFVSATAFAGGNRKKLEAENARLKDELATSKLRISELEDVQKALESTADERLRELQSLQGESEALKKQIDTKNRDLEALYAESETLQRNLYEVRNALEAKGDELSNRILSLTEKNQQLEEQLAALKSDIESALKRNDNLRKTVDDLTASLHAETGEMSQQVSQLTQQKTSLEQKIAELEQETQSKLAAEESEKQRIEKSYQQLLSNLQGEVGEKTIEIQTYKNALTINIMDQIFFNSGESRIKPDGMDVLRRVGEVLSSLPDKMIRVEGHTDDVPIGLNLRDKFPNNWMLGAARATAVAEYLRTKSGIDPTRIVVVSYSQYHPIVPNTTLEGRAKNRRIEILVVDKSLYEIVQQKEK